MLPTNYTVAKPAIGQSRRGGPRLITPSPPPHQQHGRVTGGSHDKTALYRTGSPLWDVTNDAVAGLPDHATERADRTNALPASARSSRLAATIHHRSPSPVSSSLHRPAAGGGLLPTNYTVAKPAIGQSRRGGPRLITPSPPPHQQHGRVTGGSHDKTALYRTGSPLWDVTNDAVAGLPDHATERADRTNALPASARSSRLAATIHHRSPSPVSSSLHRPAAGGGLLPTNYTVANLRSGSPGGAVPD